ncbi:MAG: U32 family peptidase [Oscillospiraceae bacterium]|nr:U32 family peptidase [Oscillospiraceae bacterium]
MNDRIEILAPVGGREQLEAAVRSGADAVYLGLGNFNARQSADNFTGDSFKDAVSYCHSRGVAVHVTLNTLVKDDEMDDLVEEIRVIAESGADAVLIQDLGVAKLVRELCPTIKMHASTQLAIHNMAGVALMKKLGFSRVVLARELSLEEIKMICDSTDLEVEVFIHGALCMCVSGCCYLSSMLGGRSGNRGRCAQPCRLDFNSHGRDHALSLKDMSHLRYIQELKDAGVASVKIEGRLKRPEYVAATVTAARNARDGEQYDEERLRSIFSRSGFTDGYYTGKRTLDMFGYRTKDDVTAFSDVQGIGELTRHEFQKIPVSMRLKRDDERLVLETFCSGKTYSASAEYEFQQAKKDDGYAGAIDAINQTGGTPFYTENVDIDLEKGLFIRLSTVKALRRDILQEIEEDLGRNVPHIFNEYVKDTEKPSGHGVPKFRIRLPQISMADRISLDSFERIIVDTDELCAHPEFAAKYADRIVMEPPHLIFPKDEAQTLEKMKKLKELGVTRVLAENAGSVMMGLECGLEVLGGAGLNIFNTVALKELESLGVKDVTVSFELDEERISKLSGSTRRGIIGYGYLPLMKFRACPMQGEKGCGNCSGHEYLVDRMGISFKVLCYKRKYSTLLNSVPLELSDKKMKGVDFETLWFTDESPEDVAKTVAAYYGIRQYQGKRTRGLYYREVE